MQKALKVLPLGMTLIKITSFASKKTRTFALSSKHVLLPSEGLAGPSSPSAQTAASSQGCGRIRQTHLWAQYCSGPPKELNELLTMLDSLIFLRMDSSMGT